MKSLMDIPLTLNGFSGLPLNLGSNLSAPPLVVPIVTSHPSVALLQKMEDWIDFLEKQTAAK